MKKVCVVTGSRAEYGILKPLLFKIKEDKDLELQLIVTGMHLSYEFGLTYKEIEKDNFFINDKVEINLSSDTKTAICKSIGLGVIGFSESFSKLNPDIVVVLGDRYEILAAANSAMIHNIPIAHIHGGETTEGAVDEAIRHSITKMSYLHFTSCETYRNRVIQLGEYPSRVFNVGALGVENTLNANLLSKEELEKILRFKLNSKIALFTYHPATLDKDNIYTSFKEILSALKEISNLKIIFTKANSDEGGRIINFLIDDYVSHNKYNSAAYYSLGSLSYLSAMKYCDIVIGNSSSGIIEAPSFKVPTVNIGDRQKGRICAKSIINTALDKDSIVDSIKKGLSREFKNSLLNMENPYGKGNSSEQILKYLKDYLFNNKIDLKKSFYDLTTYSPKE